MNKSIISQKQLLDALAKKAKGFYYEETQYEYQKTQKQAKQVAKSSKNSDNLNFFDIIDRGTNHSNEACDTIELSSKNNELEANEYELIKKKVTSHYIPPDLQAIKILFEINSKNKEEYSIENLTDQELLNLKTKLFEELKNEDN